MGRYYPKSQTRLNLYTNGDIYGTLETNGSLKPYKGFFYATGGGRNYTGKNQFAENSRLLYVNDGKSFTNSPDGIPSLNSSSPSSPKKISPRPTAQDYRNGFYTRYIAQKRIGEGSYSYFETNYNSSQAMMVKANKNFLYTPIQVNWRITGPSKKFIKNINQTSVKNLENSNVTFKNFGKFFKNKFSQHFKTSN